MKKRKLYEKIGEAIVNPNWELDTKESERVEIKKLLSQEKITQFISHVQNKMAGSYYKGAVYTGVRKKTKS